MTVNSIMIRRKNKVVLPEGNGNIDLYTVATLLKNIESLGYILDGDVITRLSSMTYSEVESFYKELVVTLKEKKGVRAYCPMYPNFPTQVMEMSEAELYLNAVGHYLSSSVSDITGLNFTWLPHYEKEERLPLLDKIKPEIIGLATDDDFVELIGSLMSANSSLSETDKDDVKWAVTSGLIKAFPEIPNKENLVSIAAMLWNTVDFCDYFKVATDVLRLAVALSDGDVSLAEPCRFRNFKRSERTYLLGLLEQCPNIAEDMLLWRDRWVRLGEKLHPGEYTNRFPKAVTAWNQVRNSQVVSFNSKVESSITNGHVHKAAELLATKPGMLARRLDQLIRLGSKTAIGEFAEVANNVSTPVLLQVMTHFKHRNDDNKVRSFFPKGNVAKVHMVENNLPSIKQQDCDAIVKLCEFALTERFSNMEQLGKVYVDPALSNYLVPSGLRSASKSLRTLVRGSRVKLPEGDTLRFFIFWKNGTGRTDIDLSAVWINEDFTGTDVISYWNLRNGAGHHSGDIVDAPKGASEFIDISISQSKHRYLAMSVNSFTHQPYKDLPECFAGWMMRQHPKSGEIYDPRTVVDRVDLSADTQVAVPVIFDLHKREAIWADLSLPHGLYINNVLTKKKGLETIAQSLVTLVRPNLYDLFRLHADGRGQLVNSPDEADVVFSVDNGTQFESEKILSEFMA